MQTVTEILIDYSTSMQGDRINICKKMLLEEVLPMIDYSSRIGVKTFTASKDKKPSITPRQGLKVTNKEELTNAISSLNSPNGNTPIAAAIKNSVASLKEYRAFKKKIILITDGKENCDGDYEAEASKAKTEGIECEIHVIGLGLKANAIEKAKRITYASGGTFSNLGTSTYVDYKSGAVKDAIVNLTKAIGKKSTNPVNYQVNTGQKNIPTQSTSRSAPNTPQKPIAQKEKPIEQKTVEPIQAEKPKQEISVVHQDEISEKGELVPDRKKIDNDYSKLTSTVETNSDLLKDIVGELKSLKTGIKELKNDGIKISQEEEDGEVIIKENKELNEKVRAASEKYVFELLKSKYGERVKWLNENGESYQDHDFEIIDLDDTIEYYIECKGTKNSEKSFLVTKNEWRLFLNQTKNYQVFFVSEALDAPKFTKIDNLLDWVLKGKVVPYSKKNIKLKSERVVLTILE
jgi:hypothetical protein